MFQVETDEIEQSKTSALLAARQSWTSPAQSPQVQQFDSLASVLQAICPAGSQANMRWHGLSNGENIRMHFHPKATEWIIFESASFELKLPGKSVPFEGECGKWSALRIDPRVAHGLRSRGDNKYFVVRDCEDSTTYLEEAPLRLPPRPEEAKVSMTASEAEHDSRPAQAFDAEHLRITTNLDSERAKAYLLRHKNPEAQRARAFLARLKF